MRARTLGRLRALTSSGRSVVLATDLDTGQQALIHGDAIEGEAAPPDEIVAYARAALADGRSRTVGRTFLNVVSPPLRLVIIGAVHIAQALAAMATLAGYAVTVIDPRTAFATAARFRDVAIVDDWPDDALRRVPPDGATAIVLLSHDPKLDDPALVTALRSPAFYVGALGSRKTQAARADRMRAAGFGAADLARIRGPVGLAIGAVTAPEIAVAILAEMIATRRGAGGS